MINLTLKVLINKLGNNNLKKSFCIYEILFLIAISELIFKNWMYNFIKILNTERLEDKGKESCTCHTWTIKYK